MLSCCQLWSATGTLNRTSGVGIEGRHVALECLCGRHPIRNHKALSGLSAAPAMLLPAVNACEPGQCSFQSRDMQAAAGRQTEQNTAGGQCTPDSLPSRTLLGHELVHRVPALAQQGSSLPLCPRACALEAEWRKRDKKQLTVEDARHTCRPLSSAAGSSRQRPRGLSGSAAARAPHTAWPGGQMSDCQLHALRLAVASDLTRGRHATQAGHMHLWTMVIAAEMISTLSAALLLPCSATGWRTRRARRPRAASR